MNLTSSLPLAEVRRQLEDLVGRRLLGPLSPSDQLRWAHLTHLEMQLLGLAPRANDPRPVAATAPGVY